MTIDEIQTGKVYQDQHGNTFEVLRIYVDSWQRCDSIVRWVWLDGANQGSVQLNRLWAMAPLAVCEVNS